MPRLTIWRKKQGLESPEGLVLRQSEAWDPLLEWVRDEHGIFFVQTTGILPVEQPAASILSLRKWLEEMDKFQLMACHDLVMLSGSIIIARAVVEGQITADLGWETSILDDIWQSEKWGDDEDANALRAVKGRDFSIAAQMMEYLRD